jgi:hypothetical protein
VGLRFAFLFFFFFVSWLGERGWSDDPMTDTYVLCSRRVEAVAGNAGRFPV